MGLAKGQLLFRGVVHFPAGTGADGTMQVMDVPVLPIEQNDNVLLNIRNGSKDENLAVDVGHYMAVYPYNRNNQKMLPCTTQDTENTFTTTQPHNLHIGDRIYFTGTGGGVTANLYYYVITITSDYVFQVSTTPTGSAFNVNANSTNFFDFVPSPTGNVNVASSSVAGDTFTCSVPHGLTVGDCVKFSVAHDIALAGVKYYVIAVTSIYVFQISAARGGTTLDVANNVATGIFAIDPEFFSLTTLTVPKFAAASYLVNVAGLVSKVVQGWPFSDSGGRLTFSPGDQIYDAFTVFVSIRRA